jgi:tetratricopeptide (TPR) repeat protein
VETIEPGRIASNGKEEYGKGNYKAAASLFAQAARAYTSRQDELNAAEMKNNESVAWLQAGKAKEALQATDGTEEVFQKEGDLKRQGLAVGRRPSPNWKSKARCRAMPRSPPGCWRGRCPRRV